jgi:hypothetical protein
MVNVPYCRDCGEVGSWCACNRAAHAAAEEKKRNEANASIRVSLSPFAAPPAFTPSLIGNTVHLDFDTREEAEAAYEALTALPDLLEQPSANPELITQLKDLQQYLLDRDEPLLADTVERTIASVS